MPTLLDVSPADLADAQARLLEFGRRVTFRFATALCLSAGGAGLVLDRQLRPAGVALLVGAATGLAMAGISRGDRRRLLVALVAQGSDIPEVRRMAAALCSSRERLRLAHSLRIAAGHGGGTAINAPLMVDPARAADAAARLRRLADAIVAPSVVTEPAALALCRQMLTEARGSPLCNARLPEAELERLLVRVERGVLPGGFAR